MKCKICMIGPDITVKGGISTVVKAYLNSSLANEYSVKYISSHIDSNKFKKIVKAISAYSKFIRVCLINKPDIVHIHSSFGASFYRKAIFIFISKIFSIPVINHIHGAEFDLFYEKAKPLKKKLIAKVYSMQKLTIVLSEEWKNNFKNIVDEKTISVIENFAPQPTNVNKTNDRKNYILFLGEVGKRKGAYDIPSVVGKVTEKRKDVKFIVCGNGDIEKIRQILIDKKIEQYVDFRGWIGLAEKIELLNESKVFFLPTYNEGLPMSILEAMAYGLPVVSSIVGGIPSLIKNDENGYVFRSGSVNEYSEAILKILGNNALRNKMARLNIEKIKNKYSLESNLMKVKSLYESLYKKKKIQINNSIRRVNVGGILVDNVDIEEACMIADGFIKENKKNKYDNGAKMVQAINTDFIVKANKDKEVRAISNITDLALADGMPVVWASRIFKQSLTERVGGPDFFEGFNKIANKNKYSYYFLGATEETVEKLISELNRRHPNIIISGHECPPFGNMNDGNENLNICERINHEKPDVVWVSFGCPKQEVWIAKNKKNINTSIIMGIGAAFQFYSGNLKRAPLIMQKMGLEWFFRFLQEPRRLWKRYLVQGPLLIRDVFTNKGVINYSTEQENTKVIGG